MKSRLPALFLVLLLCVSAFAQTSRKYVTRPFHPSADTNPATVTPATVPTWTGTTAGYTYQMVGQSPVTALTNQTTTIGVSVVPLVLTFSDGTTFDSSVTDPVCSTQGSAASLLLQSPIFNNYQYSPGGTNVGNTQYEDSFQRANFYQYTSATGTNPNYHLLLTPTLLSPIRITVPAANGSTSKTGCGRLGQVEINWLDNYLLGTVFKQLAGLGVLPSDMVVFQTYNVGLYDTTASTCCILGYHSAFNNPNYSNAVQMYALADFDTTGNFGSTKDVAAISHELGEWIDDPLGTNPTPAWGNVGQVTGCQSNLEVGDPLSGTDIPIVMSNTYTYHVQELAFVSWFFHQTPSIGVNGWYSSNDTFKTYAAACETTHTTLSITPNTLAAGSTAAVAITVKPAGVTASATPVPTGTVTLISSATSKAVATYTLTAGAVNTTISTLPSGNYALTAEYAGDTTFSPSNSAPVSVSVGTSTVSLSPVALAFGNESVGTATTAKSVTLANNGTAALGSIAISLAGASPGDYSQTNTCGTSVAAGANCSISVVFKPTATGLRTATISIADNATGSPQTVPLSGTGVSTGAPAVTFSPTSLTFASQNLGTASASQTVTIANTGTNTLTLDSIDFRGADPGDFTGQTTCGRSLAANANCTVTVEFKPTTTGARTATLSVTDNATGSPQSVTLTGTGANTGTPAVTLSAASLTFASQAVGTASATQTITLTNSGTGALSITSVNLTGTDPGDFEGNSACFGLIAAGGTCKISVSFRPHSTGVRTASLSITDNASGSPQTVTLSGTATAQVTGPGKHSVH